MKKLISPITIRKNKHASFNDGLCFGVIGNTINSPFVKKLHSIIWNEAKFPHNLIVASKMIATFNSFFIFESLHQHPI